MKSFIVHWKKKQPSFKYSEITQFYTDLDVVSDFLSRTWSKLKFVNRPEMFCERYWHKTVSTIISVNFISASPRFLIDHVIFPCSWSMQQTTNVIVLGFFVDNKWEKVISKCYWIFFELRTTLEIERHVNIDRSFFWYHVSRRISFETFQVVAFFPPRFHWLQGKVAM